jgi:amino acid transporter
MKMAQERLLPSALIRTNKRHGTPGSAIALSSLPMFVSTAALSLGNVPGSDMYDWMGSLAVFGFLTAYALVALVLPFAHRALGQHTHLVAVLSYFTVGVMILIAVFDLRSSSDAVHARIPYSYLAYIAAGIAWYAVRRKKAVSLEP